MWPPRLETNATLGSALFEALYSLIDACMCAPPNHKSNCIFCWVACGKFSCASVYKHACGFGLLRQTQHPKKARLRDFRVVKSENSIQLAAVMKWHTHICLQWASRACARRSSNETTSRAFSWVAPKKTGGAMPASNASCQRAAHRHQRSAGRRPGKPNSGRGVDRSFPRDLLNRRNSSVISAQTT